MSKPPKSRNPQSYEQALAELEGIVTAMEAGELPLEQSLAGYRRGTELLQYCQGLLKDVEQQVKILDGAGAAGTLVPFNPDPEDAGEHGGS